MSGSRSAVSRYLRQLRLRAGAYYAIRSLLALVGIGVLAFSILALAVGPVVSAPLAAVAWLACLVAAGFGGAWALRGVARLRGDRVTALLVGFGSSDLSSAARSALELDADPRAMAHSPELVAAHAARVGRALAEVPPKRVVPLTWLSHPAAVVGALSIPIAGLLLLQVDRSAAGAFALTHPGETDGEGTRVAAVVESVDVRLVYPGYLGEPPLTLRDARTFEAPRGTSVELVVHPRLESRGGIFEVAGTAIQLAVQPDGELLGRFVVREDGDIVVSLDDAEGERLRDPARRQLRVAIDEVPRVSLLDPTQDLIVELDEDVPVTWEATDDVGLRSIDLVVETPDGREVRRRLRQIEGTGLAEARGGQTVVASGFAARPGDRLRVWVEARDGDEVSGPNLGRSPTRVLTVASEATRRASELADLSAVLDKALDALADRLENEVPEDGEAALLRHGRVLSSTSAFAISLENLAMSLASNPASASDSSLYGEMARRVRRLLTREGRAHGRRPAPLRRRRGIDGELTDELENDTLLLADSLARARIEDAAAITRELEALRREIASLLSELRRADSPEARAALLAAIGRARQRMEELAARLAQMNRDVPSDFVNADAAEAQETEDILASLEQSVTAGDLDAAEQQLAELERRIDQIAAMLGGGMESFMEARFGPRERAMAEALDALAGLEAEQGQLSRRSSEVRRTAAERALADNGGQSVELAERLGDQASDVGEALDAIRGDVRGIVNDDAVVRARQRMQDVEDALGTGDLAEARRMADEAELDIDAVARDLDLSALMFPGRDGQTAEAAQQARAAADGLRELRQGLDRAIPRMERYVDGPGRQQMRGDATRQGAAMEAAEGLAESFDEGPDGTPLSPDASRGVREARDSMERGRLALERGDPVEASRAQDEAARRLTELREELEREQERQQNQGGGGGGGGEGMGSAPDFREAVQIPGAEEFEGPMALRRQLLDAMREGAPSGYEESVRRYYEELLR